MAVETLRPDGTTTGNWPSLTGAATHHAAVNDDSDASYVRNNTSTDQTDQYTLGATALTTETIGSIDCRFRARSETAATGHIQIGLVLAGNVTLAADETSISTTATTFTKTALARPGGGSWAVSDLNSLEVKIIGSHPTAAIRDFEVYVDVNNSPGGAVSVKPLAALGVG